MKNRDRIMQESFYDFLNRMNMQLRDNKAIVRIPREDHPDFDEYYACIMDCFMTLPESKKRCMEDCQKCIQAWMDEAPF